MTLPDIPKITELRHPSYWENLPDWDLWRSIQVGGDQFIQKYLRPMSNREEQNDFNERKQYASTNQSWAKAAVTDIRNAVFQRMGDIVRRGGTPSYTAAVDGYKGGVNRRGSTMNNFVGTEVLTEMLFMGIVGVYVDNIPPKGPTLADATSASPYLYAYPVEDIYSVTFSHPEDESEFQAVLLRDWQVTYQTPVPGVDLPTGRAERLRLVWIGEDGFVRYQFFNSSGDTIDRFGNPTKEEPKKLDIRQIPFVMFDIGDSLLRNIARHEIVLTNLASTDVNYALKSNFPFYIEQQDIRAQGSHLKSSVMEDGTSSTGGQGAADKEVKVGVRDGRIYPLGMDAPSFIHPSPEPIQVSLALRQDFEDQIRKLVNLSVVSLGSSRASGEARAFDNQGLESGLAYIGMVLEHGERKLANYWLAYENSNDTNLIIKYPDRYNLKSNKERLEEADQLTRLMFSIPGQPVKKELAKDAVATLLDARITPDKMAEIFKSIDDSSYSTSDPEVIRLAKEEGLASDVTLSNALGFDGETEIAQAEKDHAKRIARIQAAQDSGNDAQARGNKDLATNDKAGKQERAQASDKTMNDSVKDPTRGRGKQTRSNK